MSVSQSISLSPFVFTRGANISYTWEGGTIIFTTGGTNIFMDMGDKQIYTQSGGDKTFSVGHGSVVMVRSEV